MSRSNPEQNLSPSEIENLNRLEAVAQNGLQTYGEVGDALAEIRDRQLYRDSHSSFEAYARERWGVNISNAHPLSHKKPCEALARACEQTLSALDGDERMAIEIRVAVRDPEDPDAFADEQSWDPWKVAAAIDEELVPTLRWLLTQATDTVGKVAHQLEHRAADVDDDARAQLRDDIHVLDDELATLKALLLGLIDWDKELARLLKDEVPPLDADRDPEDDD